MTDFIARPAPTCPHCEYVMTSDDMVDGSTSFADDDLFALAVDENRTVVACPSCDAAYWVKGGYTPFYTSAVSEELLDELGY